MNIVEVEGIGATHQANLQGAGVSTTDDLLERGATASGRADLAAQTGIGAAQILEWVNHVDLMRIDGVGSEYSDLLEAAGVDSPAELAQRNAANLAQTFQELDAARPDWIRSLPSEATVAGWIAQAKALPKIVSHGGGSGGNGGADSAAPSDQSLEQATAASPVAAAEPLSFAASATPLEAAPAAAAPAASASAPESSAADEGLWARIKRLLGG